MKYGLALCSLMCIFLLACSQNYDEPQIIEVSGVQLSIHPGYILSMRSIDYSVLNKNEANIVSSAMDDIGKYFKYITSLGYKDDIDGINFSGTDFYSKVNDVGDDRASFLYKAEFLKVNDNSISILMGFYKIEDDGNNHRFDVNLILERVGKKWKPVLSKKLVFSNSV